MLSRINDTPEFSALLGRKVDLHGFLSRCFRDEVLREAEVLYDAAWHHSLAPERMDSLANFSG
jgi:hypothetical protein